MQSGFIKARICIKKDDIDKLYAKLPWNEIWVFEDPKTF